MQLFQSELLADKSQPSMANIPRKQVYWNRENRTNIPLFIPSGKYHFSGLGSVSLLFWWIY